MSARCSFTVGTIGGGFSGPPAIVATTDDGPSFWLGGLSLHLEEIGHPIILGQVMLQDDHLRAWARTGEVTVLGPDGPMDLG